MLLMCRQPAAINRKQKAGLTWPCLYCEKRQIYLISTVPDLPVGTEPPLQNAPFSCIF
jgi:hypothetical protein